MKFPLVPPGKSAAFYPYQHYYHLDGAAREAFRPLLVAFEWGALSTRDPAAPLEEADTLVAANLGYAEARSLEWFSPSPGEPR
jgi:hypothetical protein